MKTMMKKTTQYWGVSTKFFDSGKVKANIFPASPLLWRSSGEVISDEMPLY